jgi:GNAT superfamily N-acetyltransferase
MTALAPPHQHGTPAVPLLCAMTDGADLRLHCRGGWWAGRIDPPAFRGTVRSCQAGKVRELAPLPVQGSQVVLREAVVDDVPAIVALLAADQLGATREGVANGADRHAYLRAFQALDDDPAHLLLVATDGSQIVATMQISFLPGLARRGALRAQIEAVRVHADHRSRGIGAAMFSWAIDEARRRRCALVQLTTDKSRADAHRFYARLAFVASHQGLKLHL